ncbi:MAG: holdfast anchor protein HfaD [Caulobacteraceae bacterium]
MIAAILISAAPTAAISQSEVLNNQIQLGDVFSGQTLNVVSQSDSNASAEAVGNSVSGTTSTGDLSFTSSQTMSGATGSETNLNVSQFTGTAEVTSAATANTGDAQISGGGTLTATTTQIDNGASVSANADLSAPNAQVGAATYDDQAIANSQSFETADSPVQAEASQLNDAGVTTTATAEVGYMPGTGTFLSSAVGNSVGSAGDGAASQSIGIAQESDAPIVQAVASTQFGDSEATLTAATAASNNVYLTNGSGPLAAAVVQTNSSPVLASSTEISDQYGGATVSAQASANTDLADNLGPGVALDNTQSNGVGGVDAEASFSGGSGGVGYDSAVSAEAVGNSVTGYACSECGGVMAINNSQGNGSAVTANATTTIGSPGRSAIASSLAVGNAASFYVTPPAN